ncbi:MAG TPA: plastocyanin/azurin family copper-binding protein [Solirubrobacterales bacterium]|jgi:plastocyanin|nr:plastocyanin/azurin family copper-binding protein [Solirubrobacterales bacterium]
MSNETLFFVCGIALAVSAVLVGFVGLRVKNFPGKAAPFIALGFIALIGATATFAVLHAQDEEEAKAAEFSSANEEITKEEASPTEGKGKKAPAPKPEAAAKGPGGTLQLAASPTDLAFDKKSLTSKPGKVTIDFNNPAALEHNVAIEQNGEEIATSETLAEGKTSVSADLAPGTYTFLCTIPGHAEAGMEGTLAVK